MKSCLKVLSVTTLSLSFLSMQLIADEKSADQKTNSAVTHHFRTSAIEGMAVRDAAGADLGKVKDLVIDLQTGTVVYAALDFGGFIGFGDKLFAVPWDAFKIGTNDKVEHLVLATTKEKLSKAPGFDKSHWPVISDPAWSHVDEFYGPLRTAQKSTKVGVTTATANKTKNAEDKATIAKVDAKKGTVALTTKNDKGNYVEKTFQLADGVQYLDSDGKSAKIDAFGEGDHVRVTQKDGKITELKKCLNRTHATITKVDAKDSTVAVTMKDKDGKEVEKTLKLAEGVTYFDNNGKSSKIDAFQTGDHVLFSEKDGKITELKKGIEHSKAKITKVDTNKGTVSAMVKDRNGDDAERIFFLTDDIEYIDSTGEVATFEVFQSGDEVLIFESEGKIKELNKDTTPKEAPDKKVSAK